MYSSHFSRSLHRKDDMGQSIGNQEPTLVRPAGSVAEASLPPACRDLAICLGFQVDGPTGRVGTMVGIVWGSQADLPEAIEIRVGLFHRSVIVVPAEAVAAVNLSRKRVILNATPHVGGSVGAGQTQLRKD
jgi:hypothetical protein